jgi:hypothetical protein
VKPQPRSPARSIRSPEVCRSRPLESANVVSGEPHDATTTTVLDRSTSAHCPSGGLPSSPELKRFIHNIIIPALLDRLLREHDTGSPV